MAHKGNIVRKVGEYAIDISGLKDIDKLNVGCGDIFVENWLNIGLFGSKKKFPYGVITKKNNILVLNLDVTKGLPFKQNKISYIYASHFIEHISFIHGINFLKNSYAAMKKGGIIRLTFPKLELWTKKYCEQNQDFFKKYCQLTRSNVELKTKGEIFMSQVYGFGHHWNYDFESMKDILERAGFKNIRRKNPLESAISDIKKLEPMSELRLLETIYVEAEK